MKKKLFLISTLTCLSLGSLFFATSFKSQPIQVNADSAKENYWNSWIANNQSALASGGTTLVSALKTKITQVADGNANTVSYDALWNAYKTTDCVPGSNGAYIWDMYGGFQFAYQSSGSSYSDEGDCYNREHSVPKSWFGEKKPAYSDLFHLVPTDGKVNGVRNNYTFGEVNNATYTYSFPARSYNGVQYQSAGSSKLGSAKTINGVSCNKSVVFEPDDQYKGDFARIYMYFAVRYGGGECHAIKDDGASIFTNTFTNANPYVTDYGMALIKKWHELDPVSEKEINRNDAVYALQNNRNPFVDYPEWADKIFATQTDTTGVNISSTNKTLKVGQIDTISATSSNGSNINWTIDNSSICSLSSNSSLSGASITLTGLNKGNAVIMASSTIDGILYSQTCSLTVKEEGDLDITELVIHVADIPGLYATTSFTVDGYEFGCSYVANSYTNGAMQWKSGDGYMYNITPIEDISNISMESFAGGSFTGTIYVGSSSHPTSGTSYTINNGGNVTITGSPSYFTIQAGTVSGGAKCGDITISCGQEVSKTLSSISLDTSNVNKTFNVNDTFSYSGLVVTAHYDDNSSKIVNPTYVSTPDMSTAGNKIITVSYTENGISKSATYNITVNNKTITSINASANKNFYVGEIINTSNITVIDNNGDEVTGFNFINNNYQFLYSDASSGGFWTNKTFVNAITYSGKTCDLSVQVARKEYITPNSINDTLDNSLIGISGTAYTSWSGKHDNSSAIYAGRSAGGNNSIQLRSSNNDSGIVSTASGGILNKVAVSWNSNTTNGRTLNIYGKNTAYESAADLYDSNKQGNLLGTIIYGTSTELNISSSYTYIGVRSASSALYLDNIVFTYGSNETANNVANYIMFEDELNQCNEKLDIAVNRLNNMSITEKATFSSSTDYVISNARDRLNAWAISQGKTIIYNDGNYSLNSQRNMPISEINKNNIVIIITTLSGSLLISLFAYFYFKKQKIDR